MDTNQVDFEALLAPSTTNSNESAHLSAALNSIGIRSAKQLRSVLAMPNSMQLYLSKHGPLAKEFTQLFFYRDNN